MMRRAQVEHIIRAAAAVTNHRGFVLVGTGAVILAAKKPLPAAMMLTVEVDLYADGVDDPEPISDLIDGTIGQYSRFHQTFDYYGDGVGPRTAIMPSDWRSRATERRIPDWDGDIVVVCPSANDIAIAKLCAWRDKDRAWLATGKMVGFGPPGRDAPSDCAGRAAFARAGPERDRSPAGGVLSQVWRLRWEAG